MKTRYIVAFRMKESDRALGQHARLYKSFPNQKLARKSYDRLKGRVVYRCLSYGFGNILAQQGRERDA